MKRVIMQTTSVVDHEEDYDRVVLEVDLTDNSDSSSSSSSSNNMHGARHVVRYPRLVVGGVRKGTVRRPNKKAKVSSSSSSSCAFSNDNSNSANNDGRNGNRMSSSANGCSTHRIYVEADILSEQQLQEVCLQLASPSSTVRTLEIIDHEDDNDSSVDCWLHNEDQQYHHDGKRHYYPSSSSFPSVCLPLAQALLTNQSLKSLTLFPSPIPSCRDVVQHLGHVLGTHSSLQTLKLNLGHYNETYFQFLLNGAGGLASQSTSLEHLSVTLRSCFYSHIKWPMVLLVNEYVRLQQQKEQERRQKQQEQRKNRHYDDYMKHTKYPNTPSSSSWESNTNTGIRTNPRVIAEQVASIFATSILPTSLGAFANLRSFSIEGAVVVLDDVMTSIRGGASHNTAKGGNFCDEHLTSSPVSSPGLIGSALLQALAHILNKSRSLEHVTLNFGHIRCPLQSLKDFFLALKKGSTLKTIELDFFFFDAADADPEVSHKLIQAVQSHMIELKGRFITDQKAFPCYDFSSERNVVVEGEPVIQQQQQLSVIRPSKCLTPALKACLQGISALNQAGRNYILNDDMNKEKGIKVLAAVSSNLDCIFLHLSENPFLCHIH